jgi:hypothetical protein
MLNKVIYSDNGTLSDETAILENYVSGAGNKSLVAADDYVYIGSKYPVTSKYIKRTNTGGGALTLEYWDGTTWRAAVNLQNGSSAGSGYISWETDKRYGWKRDDTSVDGSERITGLGDVTLYDYYWLRLSWASDHTWDWSWVGDLYCTDDDLGSEFADLTRSAVMTAFETGKTDWEEQRAQASKLVSQDLKRLISLPGAVQVIAREQLMLPTVAKTAEIIFRGLGSGYVQSMEAARKEYESRSRPGRGWTLGRV